MLRVRFPRPRVRLLRRPRLPTEIEPLHQEKEREALLADIARANELIAGLSATVAPPYNCICCEIPPLARTSRRTVMQQLLAAASIPESVGELNISDAEINDSLQLLQQHIDNIGDVANAQQYKALVAARFRIVPFMYSLSLLPSSGKRWDFRALQELEKSIRARLYNVGIRFGS
jgi:hypothetical protein